MATASTLPEFGPDAPPYWADACRHLVKRDRVLKKVMSDARLDKMMKDPKAMPFDPKRMIWGGFKTAVSM